MCLCFVFLYADFFGDVLPHRLVNCRPTSNYLRLSVQGVVKRMKIALYSHSIPPAVDGVSRRVASLLQELTKQGHEVRHRYVGVAQMALCGVMLWYGFHARGCGLRCRCRA